MKSYSQIAQAMYAAYIKKLRKSYQEDDELWPEWDELEDEERAAWEAAAQQAAAELALVH